MKSNETSQRPGGLSGTLSGVVYAALSLAVAPTAFAGPQNGVVTAGSASISAPGAGLTQIDQSSPSVRIDWSSFNVAPKEKVVFKQPSASAVALNRIYDQNPSQIQGSLTANGRVFLINPNGIIFGASAHVDVGSLVASSLDIDEADPATGHYRFKASLGASGAIRNSGQIVAGSGGSVTLLGSAVSNDGLIVADYGSVNL
ncbi:MAG TPA: filamentous hemagglutinin N-terminal domain-containing protein, partial [Gammaproteobacteria bacterium]|nr:filamentous hemagglutinin N-terminal domain-containing protein [Gammaproteobacteria bacterium]